MSGSLTELLAAGGVVVADGAMGSTLIAAGLPPGAPTELWNVERPELIMRVHQGYLDAGAQIIVANTLGGSRIKLDQAGYGDRVSEFNRTGVQLALRAGNGKAIVAGDLGSTGRMMEPFGDLSHDEAVETFAEQAAVLEQSGADLIWIETMIDMEEARAAVVASRQATSLPIFCSLSFGEKGRTLMGQTARQVAEELWPLGLTAIGANCGEGPEIVDEVLVQMKEVVPNAPLIAKPNAGRPKLVDGATVYDMPPSQFAERVKDYVGLGARIVGACCGSNADHIAAVADVVHAVEVTC